MIYIGDVRDLSSVKNAMYGVDYIFHAAALKQKLLIQREHLSAVRGMEM
jgi:FlaA1/EpsC-like NDP-sugar epimerase